VDLAVMTTAEAPFEIPSQTTLAWFPLRVAAASASANVLLAAPTTTTDNLQEVVQTLLYAGAAVYCEDSAATWVATLPEKLQPYILQPLPLSHCPRF
jgi:hypothetical protein